VISAVNGVANSIKDIRVQAAADRKAFADRIRKTYWLDVKTAAGTAPTPPKSG
jgi:hypothetical protein